MSILVRPIALREAADHHVGVVTFFVIALRVLFVA